MPPATEPTECGSPGPGSGGGARTEAFPVGERSEAPREAPQERLQCAPSSSPTSLQCRSRGPAAGSAARLRPRPRPRPLSEPRAFGSAASATLRAPSPARAARRGAARRAGPAGQSPQAGGGQGVRRLAVGRKVHPRPPPRTRPLFSTPGTSYRCFSAELRSAPGVDRTVPPSRLLGGSGIRQVGKSWRGEGKEKRGLGALGVCVFGGGVRVRDLSLGSAVRALGRACARVVWRSDGRRS
ncbi:skin secretory protein xP2-like [Rhinolophus ferrumequinum]|uniref:skin secretory protein xP2-like n=1 Tax=Rhinolophus ferrumequinum TaxID=59479 RepID=UPI00140FF4C0|nr:skin secretory protein xP2-like [Rhinolophus ferrumequinum]